MGPLPPPAVFQLAERGAFTQVRKKETRMRAAWIVLISLALASATAAANPCKAEAKKRLTYLALDANRNFDVREFSETAIEQYRYVVDNASSRLDNRAAYLSCRNLTAMLHHAELLDERAELLEGCDETSVNSFLNSRMPAVENAQDRVGGEPTSDGIAPGDWLPIVRVAPVYPRKMLRDGIVGVVLVEFGISKGGTVVDPRAIISSDKRFEKSAIQAVRKFRYKPRVVNSERVDSTGVVTSISFSLVGNDAHYTTYPQCEARGGQET